MKKSLVVVVACLLGSLAGYAQGYVQFANIGTGLNSPFKNVDNTALTGTGFYVELLAGADAASATTSIVPLFTGSFGAGYFNGGSRNVANVTGGSAFAVVRVWDSMGGTLATYAAAAATVGAKIATSNPFAVTLQPSSTLPPTIMTGMPSLQLMTVVPEPSTLALAMLGIGALLLRRRK